jgi:hypothetical protein
MKPNVKGFQILTDKMHRINRDYSFIIISKVFKHLVLIVKTSESHNVAVGCA